VKAVIDRPRRGKETWPSSSSVSTPKAQPQPPPQTPPPKSQRRLLAHPRHRRRSRSTSSRCSGGTPGGEPPPQPQPRPPLAEAATSSHRLFRLHREASLKRDESPKGHRRITQGAIFTRHLAANTISAFYQGIDMGFLVAASAARIGILMFDLKEK